MSLPSRARVVVTHRAPDRAPIKISVGDKVMLGDHDDQWPQFVWTTCTDGQSGWVPAMLFDVEDGKAIALADYNTRELNVDAEDIVTVHERLADWWWAVNTFGDSGWVPASAIELIED